LLGEWGWQAIFLVNLPLTLVALLLGLRWLPAPPPAAAGGWAGIDIPGVVLFAATLMPILGFLLAFGTPQGWVLIAIAPVAATLLTVRELRYPSPFFDIRLLMRNPGMVSVFVQFAATTFFFYSFFFGLPIWLEQVGGYDPRAAGLLILPLTGIAVLVTPIASRMIQRIGTRVPLVIGSVFMLGGSVLMLAVGPASPVWLVLLICFVLGVPNAFNNLGLQAALYGVTPPERISWAAGQFQTFRYVGATLAGAVLGSVFQTGATTSGLHGISSVLAVVALALVVASAFRGREPRPAPEAA
jgi:predicted MFS family arabinose efflux permease